MDVAQGQALHLRLFLEGIEVPVITATVSASIGSAASAQVEIVPTDRAMEFLPRTTVHLFYLDYEQSVYDLSSVQSVEEGTESSLQEDTENTDRVKPFDTNKFYKLLFCGEVFSYSYVKSGFGQRSVILQCLDFSNMWDTSYLYTLRWQQQSGGDGQGTAIVGNQSIFLGAGNATDDIVSQPERVVADMAANRQLANNPSLESSTGIVGSLFSILELLGGVHGKHFGVNAWATIQERRIRLLDQLGGDSGATATKLYEQSVFSDWLLNKIGGGGAVMSFRDLISLINKYVYYDVVPNPVGRYIPGSNDSSRRR
jgi:hypothetical protein